MSFGEWIFWIWLVGTIIAWPITAKILRKTDDFSGESDGIVMAIVVALCVCWAWPFYIPGYWIYEWMREDGKTQSK